MALRKEQIVAHKPSRRDATLLGLVVFGALMAMEIMELVIGVRITPGALPLLVLLVVPGAGVIVWFFMHLPAVWGGEE
ncbi:MAG: hypothetical protein QF652_01180 [Dehalococcoidia bacterium]|jgi:hypothetical protein|nr:hypothetical protein [Dehalococcoidia bacterium]